MEEPCHLPGEAREGFQEWFLQLDWEAELVCLRNKGIGDLKGRPSFQARRNHRNKDIRQDLIYLGSGEAFGQREEK